MNRPIGLNCDLAKAMVEAGLLPPNVRRFIIDSGMPGELVTIHYECFADKKQLKVIEAGVRSAKIVEVPEA